MPLLHFEFPGEGSVHGFAFRDHLLDLPEDALSLLDDILRNPHWRRATDEEIAAYTAAHKPKRPAKKAE